MIGDGIQVTVLRVGRDAVRIGIEAPLEVAVHRREIYDQIREENRAAAQATPRAETLAKRLRAWTTAADDGESTNQ